MKEILVLKNARIISINQIIDFGFLKIIDNKIAEIGIGDFFENNLNNVKIIDCEKKTLLPGFIDLHVHGGYGKQFLDQSQPLNNSLNQFASAVVSEGVTKYCAATVTAKTAELDKFFRELGTYWKTKQPMRQAQLIGAYLEGPFISEKYKGAHTASLLLSPNIELVKKWQKLSNYALKIVTFAPECDLQQNSKSNNFTKLLQDNNIIASIGHSAATMTQVKKAFEQGLRNATHLYNGMSPFNHRDPGCVPALLHHKLIDVELICDGIHVNIDILQLTYEIKGAEHIIMISDAMTAKGCPDGKYYLGPLPVIKNDLKVVLADDPSMIAGSASTMIAGFKNLLVATNYHWTDCARMTAYNAAKKLKIDHLTGNIVVGHLADLILIDEQCEVILTICEGKIAFQNDKLRS